jgi:hypothetical protein
VAKKHMCCEEEAFLFLSYPCSFFFWVLFFRERDLLGVIPYKMIGMVVISHYDTT